MSLFQQVHTQIRSAGNILTIGFLERGEGKKWLQDVMLPPQQGATRAQLLACDWRVGPALSILAGMKERRLETSCFQGFIWEHKSYFDRVLCQTSPTPITHFQQKHAPLPTPSSRNKRQGHQVQGSCGLRLGMLPTPLGEILHPKTGLFIPLQRGEPQRERCRIIWDSSTHTVTLHRGRHFSKEWV